MVEYARLDAHYLLYIASCLIKELKAKDKGMFLFYLNIFAGSCMLVTQNTELLTVKKRKQKFEYVKKNMSLSTEGCD